MKFEGLDQLLRRLTDQKLIPGISVAIGIKDTIVFSKAYGMIYETGSPVNIDTRFDIASMTKILAGVCFMKLVESGKLGLDDPISAIFPKMSGMHPIEKDGKNLGWVNASGITWRQAMSHTSGMGWTRLKACQDRDHDLDDIFHLPFACQPNAHIIYTDLPIILMGRAAELISGKQLDTLLAEMVCNPLDMKNTGYLRISRGPYDRSNIAPTELDPVFRKCRVWGTVHDENAYVLDGVAGHAGVFSTAEDMCKFAMQFNHCRYKDGFLRKETACNMVRQAAEENGERRGLAWQLRENNDQAYTKLLSDGAYGHTGFTGCFFWNDPRLDLSIVLLSNDVYNGRENRKLFSYRSEIMGLIMREVQ